MTPLPAPAPWALSRWFLERTGLLLLAGGVLYVLGLRGVLLLVAAFLLSGVASFFLLYRVRDAAAGNVERRVGGISGWFRGRVTAEDSDEDLLLSPQQPSSSVDSSREAGHTPE